MSARAPSPWEDALRARLPARASTSTPARRSTAGAGSTSTRSPQVVVKIVSYSKTIRGAKNMVRYITEHGGDEERGAIDDIRTLLTAEQAEATIDYWNLTADEDNLSRAGIEARDAGTLSQLDDKDKFDRRQAVHFIVSIPADHDQVTDEQLKEVGHGIVEPLSDEGHCALFAVHRHQANPHIHVVMRYRGDNGAFRTNPRNLQVLREHAADVIERTTGLEVRADRSAEPFKHQDRQKSNRRPSGKPNLGHLPTRAGSWYERHGAVYEGRRQARTPGAGTPIPTPAPAAVPLQQLKLASERQLDQWAGAFTNPGAAKQSFLELAAENRGLAFWSANNHREMFGELEREPDRITGREIRFTKEWQKASLARIQAANRETPASEREARNAARIDSLAAVKNVRTANDPSAASQQPSEGQEKPGMVRRTLDRLRGRDSRQNDQEPMRSDQEKMPATKKAAGRSADAKNAPGKTPDAAEIYEGIVGKQSPDTGKTQGPSRTRGR